MSARIDTWNTDKIGGLHTLTRMVYPANNVNKYRRFIVLWDQDNLRRKALITHTGRWTAETERGRWGGGTYRFQRFSHVNWELDVSAEGFLQKHTARKLGGYGIYFTAEPLPNNALGLAIAESGINTIAPGSSPASSGGKVNLQSAVNEAQGEPLEMPGFASMEAQAEWLLQAAGRSDDQLELLGHYANISARLKEEESRLARCRTELESALHVIMLK